MRRIVSILLFLSLAVSAAAQEGWVMTADSRKDYNGATMANGRLGVVTDDRPFTAREIVLAGVFDKEGYNGVSRVARGPVFLNMELTVDGRKVEDRLMRKSKGKPKSGQDGLSETVPDVKIPLKVNSKTKTR